MGEPLYDCRVAEEACVLEATAHRNGPVVGLGGGLGSAKNEVANSGLRRPRPPPSILAEKLADTTGRWFGRPTPPLSRTTGT